MYPIIDPVIRPEVDQAYWIVASNLESAHQALQLLRQTFGTHPRWKSMESLLNIQFGNLSKDAQMIAAGLKTSTDELENAIGDQRASCLYRMAVAHLFLGDLRQGEEHPIDSKDYVLAKLHFRECILADGKSPSPEPLLDYAVCLSRFGRMLEEIELERRAVSIQPWHPVARLALANGLDNLARATRDPLLFPEALFFLQSIDLTLLRNPKSRSNVSGAKLELQEIISKFPKTDLVIPPYVPNQYEQFCQGEGLFLGLAQYHNGDTIVISLVGSSENKPNIYKLHRFLNEIKQSFATARLLAYEVSMISSGWREQAKTLYTDLSDGATYGTHIGKLRLAHDNALNILDKIGGFLNNYLNLGLQENRVDFRNIWMVTQDKAQVLRPEVKDSVLLGALFDLHRELVENGILVQSRRHRHASTHRYLTVHATADKTWNSQIDDQASHVGFRQLFQETLDLLRIVRSAIIYTVAFVSREGDHKALGQNLQVRWLPYHRLEPLDLMSSSL